MVMVIRMAIVIVIEMVEIDIIVIVVVDDVVVVELLLLVATVDVAVGTADNVVIQCCIIIVIGKIIINRSFWYWFRGSHKILFGVHHLIIVFVHLRFERWHI